VLKLYEDENKILINWRKAKKQANKEDPIKTERRG